MTPIKQGPKYVKNVPANKDNFPFDGDEKNISSSGHIIDKDE